MHKGPLIGAFRLSRARLSCIGDSPCTRTASCRPFCPLVQKKTALLPASCPKKLLLSANLQLMNALRFLFLTCIVPVLVLLALPTTAPARDITCDFYDIANVPDAWKASMAPGFNNAQKRSLAHYYNKEKNASVMIQIEEAGANTDLAATGRQLVASLQENGCTILSGPEQDAGLLRLEATMTGIPATIWVGTNGELTALTVISGNREECQNFLGLIRNADPLLLPQARQVRP